MKPIPRCLLLAAALLAGLPACAQYAWIDNAGRRVFSDLPPPSDIPEKNILSKHGTPVATAPATSASAVPSAPASAASGQGPGQDKKLEDKKKAAAAAQAAKRKSEEQKQAAQRADNCQRAKAALAGLQSGARIAQSDAQGQRSYMTDEQRAAETQRVQGIIQSDCR